MTAKDYNGNEIKPGDHVYYQVYDCLLTVQNIAQDGTLDTCNHTLGYVKLNAADCEKVG